MRIEPATIDQIKLARNGRYTVVPREHGSYIQQLQAIDPTIQVNMSEVTGHYTVLATDPQGTEYLVTTAQHLDQRLVDRIRRIRLNDYRLADELDRLDALAEKERQHQFAERIGGIAEQMEHAARKDLHHKNRAVIPKDIAG